MEGALRRPGQTRLPKSVHGRCLVRGGRTVYVDGGNGVAYDGLGSTGVHFDVAFAYGLQDGARIEGGLVHGGIAVDGADSEELDTRVVAGEEEGICVLWCAVSVCLAARRGVCKYIVSRVLCYWSVTGHTA